jgi:hypothetical protein
VVDRDAGPGQSGSPGGPLVGRDGEGHDEWAGLGLLPGIPWWAVFAATLKHEDRAAGINPHRVGLPTQCLQAKDVAVEGDGSVEIGDLDGEVVQAHGQRMTTPAWAAQARISSA